MCSFTYLINTQDVMGKNVVCPLLGKNNGVCPLLYMYGMQKNSDFKFISITKNVLKPQGL